MLADEINRASPKTQSALLEAMQERQITFGNDAYALASAVLRHRDAEPDRDEGTYPLPEAQLDRFLLKLLVASRPSARCSRSSRARPSTRTRRSQRVADARDDRSRRGARIRQMPVADSVADYAVRLVFATHPAERARARVRAALRALRREPARRAGVVLVGKFLALLDGRLNVSIEDVQRAAYPCLRHRVLLNFDAIAEDTTPDALLKQTLMDVQPPKAGR